MFDSGALCLESNWAAGGLALRNAPEWFDHIIFPFQFIFQHSASIIEVESCLLWWCWWWLLLLMMMVMMMTIRTSITHVPTFCGMFIFLSVHLIKISKRRERERKERTSCLFHSSEKRLSAVKKWNYRRWTRERERGLDMMMSVVVKYLEACCCRHTLLIILSRSTTATWSSNTSILSLSLSLCQFACILLLFVATRLSLVFFVILLHSIDRIAVPVKV